MASQTDSRIMTEYDRVVLESYKTVLDGLSDYLGSGYELVLHNLEDYNSSIIAIKNGHYTNRKIGDPITNLAVQMLHKIENSESPMDYLTYFTVNHDGIPLKSTTITIRGLNARIIGLLCINFYLNIPLCDHFAALMPHNGEGVAEHFTSNSDELITHLVEDAQKSVNQDRSIPSNRRSKRIVYELADQGAFNLKNAALLIAEQLGISKNTVYLHLRSYKADKALQSKPQKDTQVPSEE